MIDTQTASKEAGVFRRAATAVLLLAAFTALISLGTWQVKRLAWKEALLADIAARQAMPPVGITDIGELLASGGDIEYRPLQVTGTFKHNAEQFFFATFDGNTGYYVYTPLELEDGQYLFVNRGFVPYDAKAPDKREAGEIEGEVTITGLARARLIEKPGMFVPDNDPAKNIFYWKDLDAMTANAGLPSEKVLQFFLDADGTHNPGGLPVGGVTQIDFPNNHLQYAITWYGLAAVLAVISGAYWLKERQRRDN